MLPTDHDNDQLLLSGLLTGDPQAYTALYERYYDQLTYFVLSMVHDRAAAEDVAVDTFISLITTRPEFTTMDKLKSWLFTTAHRRCLNWLRDDKRHRAVHEQLGALGLSPTQQEAHDLALIKSEAIKILHHHIEKLPPQIRQVISLSFLDGKSVSEIAATLGTATQTVQNQKARGLQLLREALLKSDSLRALTAIAMLQALSS